MPAAARKTKDGVGSKGGEHIGFAPDPAPITEGSGDVNINGKAAARLGDETTTHVKPGSPPTPHDPSPAPPPPISEGSSTVFINDKKAARKGDKASCGAFIKTGSGDVNIGG